MGEYLKRCEGGRAMNEEDMQVIFSKKRKLYSVLENVYCGDVKLSENSVSSAASVTFGCSEDDWSSDDVKKSFRSPDLENVGLQSEETEISSSINGIFSGQSTPTSEVCGDSEQVLIMRSCTSKKKSSSRAASSCRNISSSTAEKIPSAEEIEEFFAAAEKYEQKRFAEKYNYDIVKDVPLEGKYQWVRLQP